MTDQPLRRFGPMRGAGRPTRADRRVVEAPRYGERLRDAFDSAERRLRVAGDASLDGVEAVRMRLGRTVRAARERLLDADDAARAHWARTVYLADDLVSDRPARTLLVAACALALAAWVLRHGVRARAAR